MKSTLMNVANKPEPIMVSGSGHYLTDASGQRYLDFVQGWAANSLGHCPPELTQAILEQSQTLIHAGPGYHTGQSHNVAERLSALSGYDQVTFANSGAEANECAIKLARKWGEPTGRYKIITFEGCFHGRTLATMSASGKASFDALYNPKVPGFMRAPWQDIDTVAELIDNQTCAIMLELVQGEAGVHPATHEFISQLAVLAREQGVLLIVDEVQTGIGRTGQLFCFEHYGIKPSIVTLGKGLGGGMPVSAILCDTAIACFEPGDQGGTFNGNALVMSAVTAVLDQVSLPEFLEQVQTSSAYLFDQLSQFGDVRGKGLLLALDMPKGGANAVVDRALTQGLLLNAPNDDCLRFMPALNVTKKEVDQMIELLAQLLEPSI